MVFEVNHNSVSIKLIALPVGTHLFKVNNRNSATMCEIYLFKVNDKYIRATSMTHCSGVSNVNFEQVNAGWIKTKITIAQ